MHQTQKYSVGLNSDTRFILSTSGSQSSIVRHNEALKHLSLNLVYFTMADPITPDHYAQLIRTPMIHGAAVTGRDGLKSTIIPFLDEVEELALKTRAVNTVVNRDGKLSGYNSDAIGLKTALTKALEQSHNRIKTAVIYGNGGVAGVAWHVLKELGMDVSITGRNPQRVKAKMHELGLADESLADGPYDLLVDATPISSQPDFLKAEGFQPLLDHAKMIFCHNMPEKDSHRNYLQHYCETHNIDFIPGQWMYKAQLIRQYRLYFDAYTTAKGLPPVSDEAIIEAWGLA